MKEEAVEQKLIEDVCDGNAIAMRKLYDCYAGYLTAIATRYIPNDDDLKDVLQESFVKIFTAIRNFKYQGRGSLKAWMSRIVINESLDYIDSHKRDEALVHEIGENDGDIDDVADDCDYPDIGNVPMEVVYDLVRHLPDGYRSVFNLYVFEGKSHKEIARTLDIKESTSASQLHRAKSMLARQIKEYLTTHKGI